MAVSLSGVWCCTMVLLLLVVVLGQHLAPEGQRANKVSETPETRHAKSPTSYRDYDLRISLINSAWRRQSM
jgi:hypothetical protein